MDQATLRHIENSRRSAERKRGSTIKAVIQALGLMPQAYKLRMFAACLTPSVLVSNFRFWHGGNNETLPVPTMWARLLVAGSSDVDSFLASGRRGFDCIRETAERNGRPLDSLRDVLDFGCGCGRVTRYWNGLPNTRIHGTDMNEYLVTETQRCVPYASIGKNSVVAKLDYANESFDLIYAFSVFTHLDVTLQKQWRDEFHRILRPGGLLLVTVHGDAYKGRLETRELEDFQAGRPVVRQGQFPGGNLCVAFHPETFARELLGVGFDIVEVAPEGAKGNPPQDLYTLRRIN